MEVRNGSHEAEAQTVARSPAALLQSIEALEHVPALMGRDSRSVVRNENHDARMAPIRPDCHPTFVSAMLDGVIDEVGQGIEQEVSIRFDDHGTMTNKIEPRSFVLRRSIEELCDLRRDIADVDGAEGGGPICRVCGERACYGNATHYYCDEHVPPELRARFERQL